MNSMTHNATSYLQSLTINQDLVFKALKRLDQKKGAGSDAIPHVFAKKCAKELCYPLTVIYNLSLKQSIFPSAWKESIIVPIPKTGDANLINNYRPISILSVFDDLKILRTIKSTTDSTLLQKDINSLAEWCNINKMKLNSEKCYHIRFSRHRSRGIIAPSYQINNHILATVDKIKDLGVYFDAKLNFHAHFNNIINNGFKMLGFLLRTCKNFRNPLTKITLFNALVRSKLEYCSVIWNPKYKIHINNIERIQKRFLWHLAYSCNVAKKIRSYSERLDYFKIRTLYQRRKVLDQVFLHKLVNGSIDCASLVSQLNFKVPVRLPRNSNNMPFHTKFHNSNLGHYSGISRLTKEYNNIVSGNNKTIDIFSNTVHKFKKELLSIEPLPKPS
ncbi:uncharacterized protein LOC123705431 [Colias croceus]|nr:uncharacterized protein LOC123705431 [Colias croceus]